MGAESLHESAQLTPALWPQIAALLVPTIWASLLIGVAFIATPAKFQAPSLSLAVAMDVGRVTFALFNPVEWLMLALFVPVIVLAGADRMRALIVGALAIILIVQTGVLMPVLDARLGVIIAGGSPPPSSVHLIYIGLDVLKLLVLGAMVWKECVRILAMARARVPVG